MTPKLFFTFLIALALFNPKTSPIAQAACTNPCLAVGSNAAQSTSQIIKIKGVRLNGPDGGKTKCNCHWHIDPRYSRPDAVTFVIDPAVLSGCICEDIISHINIDLAEFGQPSGSQFAFPSTACAVKEEKECVTDQKLAPPAGHQIRYTSEMTTTKIDTLVPKKEKGPLVYELTDGTIFVGTMQLKY
jgi:hypothetical protein